MPLTSINLLIENIERNQFRFNYLKNKKLFFGFFLHFRNLSQILNIFKQTMTLIAYLFLILRPAKNVVKYMCKKSRFRLPFQKEHGKRVSALFKSEPHHLYHINWSIWRILNCNKSLLVIWKILRLFVNILSALENYSLPNRQYLTQPIQIELSQKQKSFSRFFLHFRNLR